MEKLKRIPDALVCEALTKARWAYFPSVDDVLRVVEEIQETLLQQAGESEFECYRREQKRAELEGLLASEADYAVMRKRLRELFGDPTAKQARRTA